MIFRNKKPIPEEEIFFQIETYRWLLRNLDITFLKNTELILPTDEFFPISNKNSTSFAKDIFTIVKKNARMEFWACEIVPQENDPAPPTSPLLNIDNPPSSPHGTFSYSEGHSPVITYNPSLTDNPMQLVATFAHELSHYLTATFDESPPGGWENWEFATDITAVFLGFGIFLANTAFSFHQYSDIDHVGWRCQRSGYLSEAELVYALAIFMTLKEIPTQQALIHLKPNLQKMLKRSIVDVNTKDILN